MTILYCAKWVLPVSSGPVDDGAVAVEGELIVDVGSYNSLRSKFPDAPLKNFGEAAIIPGLVNCHSHLELSAMRGFLEREEGDFFAWLKKLTIARLERMTPDDLKVSAAWGAIEAVRSGVTCVGDASDAAGASMSALRDVGLRGTVYQESFGPDPKLATEHFDKLREKVTRLREFQTPLVRVGISPHAPYTVSPTQLELISEYALAEDLPVMMHAAESEAEMLFVREGRGPFAESLALRGIEWRAPGVSTVRYLSSNGFLKTKPLLAHCIHVDEADLEALREADARIAHCPKSNAKLGHGRAPFAAFIKHHLKVGLGSDSVASNNICDMFEEARFAVLLSRSNGDNINDRMINAWDALRAATLGGAEALGLEGRVGAIEPGMQADLTAVSVYGVHQQPVHDPVAAVIFATSGRDVRMTMVAGKEIYDDGRVTTVDEERLRGRINEIRRKISSDK
jgi:cytosine/adenosine deaminase-related metal-dependent hydrolase